MKKVMVNSSKAPEPIGPYNQAVGFGDLIFTSGQLGIDASTNAMAGADVASQTRQALENLKAVLEAGGSHTDKVVKTTVFLRDMADFKSMNEVYAQYFSILPPARSTVQAARLPLDALVEIECVAYR